MLVTDGIFVASATTRSMFQPAFFTDNYPKFTISPAIYRLKPKK